MIKRLPRVANLAPLKVVTEDSPHTTAAKRLSPTCLMGKFRNGELTTGFIELNANFRDFTLHYGLPPSNLLSLPWIKGVLRADAVEH